MKPIEWEADTAAIHAGIPAGKLTGGVIIDVPAGGQAIRFREIVQRGGKEYHACLRLSTRPELVALVARLQAEEKEEIRRRVTIYLSSRGWGDYSACEWTGDITRPDAEILTECKTLLTTGHDVDQAGQSDDEVSTRIRAARANWETAPERKAARERAEAEDLKMKADSGFCFYCETWCHGDCGHFSADPSVKFRRNARRASGEANYGIND